MGAEVCLTLYRTIVARAEGGLLTKMVRLPPHLKLAADEVAWLKNVAGVKEIRVGEELTEPTFHVKVTK